MADNARRHEEPAPRRTDPFSLEAYLERQRAEFADGPTMAEILEDLDRFREGGIPRETIAATVREDRDA
ncbi:hypothetical protein [Amycolatopsis alkalitolerans]|uniref:Uncharacterized protein n=1 Tax=Amycolatopsis alkalitolerans TaxID=2547244 RepID=A0A5C4M4X8_9PSEU|nr:hypothetical protein [Amycolatopsis alkalitolerans]TNC26436.1 hypothetical protein FG385_11820 [Amycolatopsis alkalitolerans]